MRARYAAPLLAMLLLSGCGGAQAAGPDTLAVAAPTEAPQAPPEEAGPPDGKVKGAKVPIAGVDAEAEGVSEGTNKGQGRGIGLSSDKDKGKKGTDVTDTELAGGCHPDYGGLDGACLPPVPPRLGRTHAGHGGMDPKEMSKQYKCNDVRELIPNGIAVRVVDSLGLDSNQDGVACGVGDK
jgi:hypothetical protein